MRLSYGWAVVGAGMVLSCLSMGSMFALAVYMPPMAADTGWSKTGISGAMTIDFLCMGLAAFFWGALSDRFGTRAVVLAGSILQGIGTVLASQASSLLEFQVYFGGVVGIAVGAFYAPLMATASGWFENNRSLAVALISAGMGAAPLIVAPTVRHLITVYDWRTAMLIVGIALWVLMIPAALLIRRPPVTLALTPAGGGGAPSDGYTMSAGRALRTPQFFAIALTHFFCCAAHSGPIFHMVSYAMVCGIGAMTAVTVYSVAGLSGLAGRLLLGVTADRVGVKPTLVVGLLVQAAAAGTYLFVGALGEFYALSVVFGIAYGGVMPLYAVLVRNYFGPHIMGTMFGGVSALASLGMALGPVAGGWVFDSFQSYNWLYVGSFGVGLGAVAIMLTFRPTRGAAQAARPLAA
ncbi:MAG: MFS transporter [Alphaproteobacteria bacterium]|nr:MFS transporter [Alphaproteobacteria bacterium]MCW5743225.1 MFS transporter [Alphaproteobacteria bacterium]